MSHTDHNVQAGIDKQGYLVRRHGSNDLDELGEIRLHQRPALSSNNTLGANCLCNSTNEAPNCVRLPRGTESTAMRSFKQSIATEL